MNNSKLLNPSALRQILLVREQYLIKIIRQKEQALSSVPNGSLRITHSKNRPRYYLNEKSSKKPHYLKDKQLVRRLAQKGYDEKILRTAQKEHRLIHTLLNQYPNPGCEEIIHTLPQFRSELITPIQLSDDDYLAQWCAINYDSKKISDDTPAYYTEQNEHVRSKSEILIANLLNKKGVPYKYECPLKLQGIGTIYPDFTILNIRTRTEYFHEHFGMMDNPEYAEQAIRRIHAYENNGIFPGERLICTFETRTTPLNMKILEAVISNYYL